MTYEFENGMWVGIDGDVIVLIGVNFMHPESENFSFHYNDIDGTFEKSAVLEILGAPNNSDFDWIDFMDAALERYVYFTIVSDGWVEQAVSFYFNESDMVAGISFAWNS